MGLEKEKKRKRRIGLVVALIAILLVTVFLFWYTHQTGTGREKYSVHIEDEMCNVTVTETLPSKLDIYIDSRAEPQVNYTVWARKNVTFYIAQEIESTPEIDSEEKESSILYHICLENYNFSWVMMTFLDAHTGEYKLTIEIEEHFTSFFMQFETYRRISE